MLIDLHLLIKFKDVFLLCDRFELEIPKEYQNFKKLFEIGGPTRT